MCKVMIAKIISLTIVCSIWLNIAHANPVIKAHSLRNHQFNVQQNIPRHQHQAQLTLDDINQLSDEQIQKAIRDVRTTINEVQKRLALDPNLPRLTKGEIEELFENVTREELTRSIHMGDHRREKHMRALMLVLPYHAKDVSPDKIQQLYTKSPVTSLINNNQVTADSTKIPAFRPLVPRTTTTEKPITAIPSLQRYPPPMPVEPFGLRDSIIPENGTPAPFATPTEPPRPTTNVKINKFKKVPLQLTIAQKGKVDIASISITKAPLYTTTTKKPTRNPQSVFEILEAIGLHQQKVKAAQMATSTTTTTTTTTQAPPSTTTQMNDDMKNLLAEFGLLNPDQTQIGLQQITDVPYVPDIQYEPPYSFSLQNQGLGVNEFKPLSFGSNEYQNFAPVYPGYTILETGDESRASGSQKVQVSVKAPDNLVETTASTSTSTTTSTTTTTTTEKPKITKPKVNKPADFKNFKPLPFDSPKAIGEDFQDILRSFGLLGGQTTTTKSRVAKKQKVETTTDSTTTSSKPSTEASIKEMPEIINIPLPSEMMGVLKNLGVSTESPMAIKVQVPSSTRSRFTSRAQRTSSTTTEKATISESSTTEKSTTQMDVESNDEVIRTTSGQASGFSRRTYARTSPSTTSSTTPKSTTRKRYTSTMKPIIVAEIPMEKPRKIDSYSRTNIFKPTTSAKETTKDDYKKLEHLLETIKELDKLNTTLSAKHLDQLDLNNFNFSESLTSQGPNPLHLYANDVHALKNEIKRQEPKDDNDNPTKISLDLNDNDTQNVMVVNAVQASEDLVEDGTTFSPLNQISDDDDTDKDTEKETTEKITTTTTEEGRSASADELKDSFPNDEDPDEPVDEELPPPRRNGFYFLADWNSFLEVGQDEEKVVVRFDPKIGDPSRFLSVNIPSKFR
uniref:CSON002089 protein n=1 Tax=Culicoides sonorensis TaxID=179676 RepID=A0A336MJQ7_CULSO